MNFYVLKPEVGGNIFGPNSVVDVSVHPPRVTRLDYEFDGWSGDDIVTSQRCYIVTSRLEQALRELAPTGSEFAPAQVSKSEQFEELYPDQELPPFTWLKITGRAGIDDFGETERYGLVVSERVLRIMQQFQLDDCQVEEYAAALIAA